jgi:hypothetical protein
MNELADEEMGGMNGFSNMDEKESCVARIIDALKVSIVLIPKLCNCI